MPTLTPAATYGPKLCMAMPRRWNTIGQCATFVPVSDQAAEIVGRRPFHRAVMVEEDAVADDRERPEHIERSSSHSIGRHAVTAGDLVEFDDALGGVDLEGHAGAPRPRHSSPGSARGCRLSICEGETMPESRPAVIGGDLRRAASWQSAIAASRRPWRPIRISRDGHCRCTSGPSGTSARTRRAGPRP